MGINLWRLLTRRITVFQDSIAEKRDLRTIKYSFKDVTKIGVLEIRTKSASWNVLALSFKNSRKPKPIDVMLFDNMSELHQAIIEHTVAIHPEVEVDDYWIEIFGRPPYALRSNISSSSNHIQKTPSSA
jgi:hypothetical protein